MNVIIYFNVKMRDKTNTVKKKKKYKKYHSNKCKL